MTKGRYNEKWEHTRIKAKQTGKGKYKGIMTKDRYKGDIQMKKGTEREIQMTKGRHRENR